MIKILKCLRCNHEWPSRMERLPKVCPKCKSPYWSLKRWKGIKNLKNKKNSYTVNIPGCKARFGVYTSMYKIAKEHAFLAEKQDGIDIVEEIQESMISIIFAYSCLETYINTLAIDYLGMDLVKEKNNFEGRLKGVTNRLIEMTSGKKMTIFNKKEEPYKSFLQLQEIRRLLIHFKEPFKSPVATKYGVTAGLINIVNSNTAKTACETVSEMIKKINMSYMDGKPVDWLKLQE